MTLIEKVEREAETTSPSVLIRETMRERGTLTVVLDDVDLHDERLEFALGVYVSEDGERWRHKAGMTCYGRDVRWAERPSLGIRIDDLKGLYVRCKLTTNRRLAVGIDFEDSRVSDGTISAG